MESPGSPQRMRWILDRLQVIDLTIRELSTRPNRNPSSEEVYRQVQFNLRVEKCQLYAEYLALKDVQDAKQINEPDSAP